MLLIRDGETLIGTLLAIQLHDDDLDNKRPFNIREMKYRYFLLPILALTAGTKAYHLPSRLSHSSEQQHIMSPPSPPSTTSQVLLPDILGRPKHINVFTSLTRDTPTITELLSSPSQYTVILAPQNSAITSLPQKPWEDEAQYSEFGADAFEGEVGMERARNNIEKFVGRYVGVAGKGNMEGWQQGQRIKTVDGEEVWWEMKEGKKIVMPWHVGVMNEIEKVANGELWVLEGLKK